MKTFKNFCLNSTNIIFDKFLKIIQEGIKDNTPPYDQSAYLIYFIRNPMITTLSFSELIKLVPKSTNIEISKYK